ncbi:lytic polysaccharide monooxygenase [Trametes coccinea BRFM310]|uniref:lytic cellulose monooxygenase (C4-dehydrogenating) n=1 Tax=Trametes coccinea (strain BRFM310) TaxID=1353009 RepID=A0A1Y2I6A6_TRAC3|nr:lytic polysaccharide monooxygenase [Trametes coccinea BRFM310]
MNRTALFLALAAALRYVAAHGYLAQVSIDGKAYAGNIPNDYQGPSPIRLVSDIGPVKGASNPDLFCGLEAQIAELVVPANPGSAVAFQWSGGDHQKWPHNTGPLMTYMAKCGSTTCDKFNDTDAQWFKIDQAGKKSNDSSQWVQQDIMNGDSYTVTLPQDLPPGDYLIRHEIIALHLAVTMGGAEFYPSCTQVRVGGSGSGSPNNLVTFPGAYHDDDPGIYDPNVFDAGSSYTFPGPAISNLAAASAGITPPESQTATFPASGAGSTATATDGDAGSGSGSGASATSVASPSASAGSGSGDGSSSTGAVAAAGSKAQCRLQKRSTGSVNRPRHYSRIMSRILHLSS